MAEAPATMAAPNASDSKALDVDMVVLAASDAEAKEEGKRRTATA